MLITGTKKEEDDDDDDYDDEVYVTLTQLNFIIEQARGPKNKKKNKKIRAERQSHGGR